MDVRAAGPADLPALTETISLAFHNDPVWSSPFPDPASRQAGYTAFWGFLIKGALRYPWVMVTESYEAAAVWIPPGGTEVAPEDEALWAPLAEELFGSRAGEVLELIARFEENHPHTEPHYYLSLLGTHPDHAGRGIGMRLLAENLARIDAEHMPAYLESTNPANNPRYERHGFVTTGAFYPPSRDVPITTMWRDAR
jgi:GNAT superfamily N-acetyltransferase